MRVSRRALLAAAAGLPSLAAGCAERPSTPTPSGTPAGPPPDAAYAYTHQQPSGNRLLPGDGDVLDATPVEIPVEGTPAWLLGFDRGTASEWILVTGDGTATTYRVGSGDAERLTDHGAVPTPPLGYLADGAPAVVTPPRDAAADTHPVFSGGAAAYVADDGDIVLRQGMETTRAAVSAPPDVRPVALGDGRYVLYGGRTDRYRHGAVGDAIEGSSLVVIEPAAGTAEVVTSLDPPTVFEGLYPLVADLDDDGDPEVVTTVATTDDGARIRVYAADGTELATGPVYGPGWRHQLCVAPFGPEGTPELAAVLKPHVDRTLEYYRLVDDELTIRATRAGYATHAYGSRNIDGALAGDVDDDGRPELLLPTADRTTLAAVRRVPGGTELAGSLSLDAPLTTNLVGVGTDDGIAIGAGTVDGVRIWTAGG
jgi:hypothetical protein